MTPSPSCPPITAADATSEDTAASETAIAPSTADCIDETVLAWSDVDAIDTESERATWRAAWGRAAAVLAGCLAVAAVIALAWRALPADRSPADARAPVADATTIQPSIPAPRPTPAAAPSPPLPATTGSVAQKMTTPPVPAAAVDPDAIYLQMLSDAGVKAPTNEKAIANGHLICQQLAQGNSVQAVISVVARVNPSLDPARSTGTVYAAIDAYCPQYENRGEY